MNTTVSSGTSRQLTVTLHTRVNGVETAITNVTSAATYTSSNSAITVSSGGKITWNNNSTAATTATVTVSYPSADVEPVVVNVTVTGKAVEPEPVEGTISEYNGRNLSKACFWWYEWQQILVYTIIWNKRNRIYCGNKRKQFKRPGLYRYCSCK